MHCHRTRRHHVHGSVWVDPSKRPGNAILSMDHNDGLAEKVDIHEIAWLWELRDVSHTEPILAQDVFDLPVDEGAVGIGLGGKRDRPFDRQVICTIDFSEDFPQDLHLGYSPWWIGRPPLTLGDRCLSVCDMIGWIDITIAVIR